MNSKKLVVGNWKMNPSTLDEAKRIAQKTKRTAAELAHTEAVICPPFTFLSVGLPRIKAPHFHAGAQAVSAHESGAHTGEVSAHMLRDVGIEYVIVGHSETRQSAPGEGGDTDATVALRVKAALDAGLTPIVCFGEKTRDESGSHYDFIKNQMKASLDGMPKKDGHAIVIAYEPIWAIGAKEAMAPDQVCEMTLFVRKTFADLFGTDSGLHVPVLYGGSVNFRNAADIIKIGQVDGLLVGRESVNATGFIELLKAVDAAA